MRIQQAVGQKVQDARQAAGLSQSELGKALGEYLGKAWSRQAVSAAEAGNREFTAAEMLSLAFVLDVPVSWLFFPPDQGERYTFPNRHMSKTFEELVHWVVPRPNVEVGAHYEAVVEMLQADIAKVQGEMRALDDHVKTLRLSTQEIPLAERLSEELDRQEGTKLSESNVKKETS